MEYWLKCGEDSIQLPIRPSAFQITQENSHQMVNVQTRGDVTILGKKGLKTDRNGTHSCPSLLCDSSCKGLSKAPPYPGIL